MISVPGWEYEVVLRLLILVDWEWVLVGGGGACGFGCRHLAFLGPAGGAEASLSTPLPGTPPDEFLNRGHGPGPRY